MIYIYIYIYIYDCTAEISGKNPPAQSNTIITFHDKPTMPPEQKASAFNNQFDNTIQQATENTNRKVDRYIKALSSTPIHITANRVLDAISSSFNNNSTGPDQINIRHWKHLEPLAIEYLTDLLNLALNL